MENSGSVLFENDDLQWYVAVGERWMGPLTAQEVYQKVTSGEVTWAHYIWRMGLAEWTRICDITPFRSAVPKSPPKSIPLEIELETRTQMKASGAKTPLASKAKTELK